MKVVIASTNAGKVAELQKIFAEADTNFQLESISHGYAEPDEPYDTFMENAKHKAKYYAQLHKQPSLSDDSGLCIESLNGFPGVRTKEFVVECGSLDAAYQQLQEMLQAEQNYDAHFVCAVALYLPDEQQYITSEAKVNGKLIFPPHGNKGFGFDPIFIPTGYDKTFAELGDAVKNSMGHRAQAARGLLQKLIHVKGLSR